MPAARKFEPDTHAPVTNGLKPPWMATNGTYIAGQAHLDEADKLAVALEAKWGAGRLRLLVGAELREKFDRQRYLLNRAVWHGDLEGVRREATRMQAGWRALDRAATEAGAEPLSPQVWETTTADGTVIAVVPSSEHAGAVQANGRRVAVYTLDEIARLVADKAVTAAKLVFPGATVTQIRKTIPDALDAIADTDRTLDDVYDDAIPF